MSAGLDAKHVRREAARVRARSQRALARALERSVPGVTRDARGYVDDLQANLVAGIGVAEIEREFRDAAGKELEGQAEHGWMVEGRTVAVKARARQIRLA